MYENLLKVPRVVALVVIVEGSPVPVPVPKLSTDVEYGIELVALARGLDVEIGLGSRPAVIVKLVAFIGIEKLAEALGSYVDPVPEGAGITVALAEIAGLKEGSEDEKTVLAVPEIEFTG